MVNILKHRAVMNLLGVDRSRTNLRFCEFLFGMVKGCNRNAEPSVFSINILKIHIQDCLLGDWISPQIYMVSSSGNNIHTAMSSRISLPFLPMCLEIKPVPNLEISPTIFSNFFWEKSSLLLVVIFSFPSSSFL